MALSLRRNDGSWRDRSSIAAILFLFASDALLDVTSLGGTPLGVEAATIPSSNDLSWDTRDYDFSLGVTKRDICSDTLPGSVSSNCTPSNTTVTTLCCVRPDSVFPQCGVYLGVGFCVVDETDTVPNGKEALVEFILTCEPKNNRTGGSYTDTESVCDSDPNSTLCGSDGDDVYCCPEHTRCAKDSFSDGSVRCEAYTSDLEALTATTTTSSTSTRPTDITATMTSGSSTSTAATTTDNLLGKMTDLPLEEPGNDETGLSGGAIAGVAVSVFVALVIAALVIWSLVKRNKKLGPDNNKNGNAYGYFTADQKTGAFEQHEMDAEGTAVPTAPHELDPQSRGSSISRIPPQELPSQNNSAPPSNLRPLSPQELEAPISTFSPFQDQSSQSR
ncbi:hypothetical protein FQN54_006519 [Arachnomyces sp. PD_36]|nr:hypothetical protein FQN54_006519 [Arachnomyces sp. PD_36]